VFAALPFGSLAIITCLLYTPALVLEFLALIILRVRRPTAPRSFRVPGGWSGMICVCVVFFSGAFLVLLATMREWTSYPGQLLVVGMVVLSGVALYVLRRRAAS
jgi:amino acid transporter